MAVGQAVPAFTGRHTYVGHYEWTPNMTQRTLWAQALFTGRMPTAQARALVRFSRARFLLSDCAPGTADLRPVLGSLMVSVRQFGCATLYQVRR